MTRTKLGAWLVGLFLVLFFSASYAFAGPKIDVKTDSHDFGEAWEGETLNKAFEVKNIGDEDLVIETVKTSCGCTAVKFDNRIAPGKTGFVTLSLRTQGLHGAFHKTGTIHSNDPASPRVVLKLTGSVKNYIEVTPRPFLQLVSSEGETDTKTLMLKSTLQPEFELSDLTVDPVFEGKLKTNLTRVDKQSYQLEVTSLFKEIGSRQGRIRIKTNVEKKPELEIRVMAMVLGPIQVAPGRLHFGRIENVFQAEKTRRTVWLRKLQGNDFKITSLDYDHDLLNIDVQTRRPGKDYLLMVSLKGKNLKKGTLETEIVVHTDHEKAKTLKIPVIADVTVGK